MSILARVCSCLIFLQSFVSPYVYAAQTPATVQNSMAIGKMLLGLSFIVILIYVLAWLAKRLTQSRLIKNDSMHILSAMALGPKEKAILVNVEDVKILIGVSPAGVNALHVFEKSCGGALQSENVSLASSTLEGVKGEASKGAGQTSVLPMTAQHQKEPAASHERAPGAMPQGAMPQSTVPQTVDFASHLKSMLNLGAGK